MISPLVKFPDVKNAVRTNQINNYLPRNTNNNYTSYNEGDLNPTSIFPNGGVYNNIGVKPYNYNPFIMGTNIDEHNPIGTNFKISRPFFNNEDDKLPDLISIGHQNSKIARIIGTSIY